MSGETKTTGVTKTTCNLDLLADVVTEVRIKDNVVGLKINNIWISIDTIENSVCRRKEFMENLLRRECTHSDGRHNINILVGIGENAKYTKFRLGTLVAFVKDIYDNNGMFRDTYIGLAGNHKDGSGSGSFGLTQDNSYENMELIDANSNSLHYCAWRKLLNKGYWFSISGNNKDFLNYVVDKESDIDIQNLQNKFSIEKVIKNNRDLYIIR